MVDLWDDPVQFTKLYVVFMALYYTLVAFALFYNKNDGVRGANRFGRAGATRSEDS